VAILLLEVPLVWSFPQGKHHEEQDAPWAHQTLWCSACHSPPLKAFRAKLGTPLIVCTRRSETLLSKEGWQPRPALYLKRCDLIKWELIQGSLTNWATEKARPDDLAPLWPAWIWTQSSEYLKAMTDGHITHTPSHCWQLQGALGGQGQKALLLAAMVWRSETSG